MQVAAPSTTTFTPMRPVTIPNLPKPGDPTPVNLGSIPAPDSPESKAEVALQVQAQKLRTPALDAWARDMNDHGILDIWRNEIDDIRRGVSTLQEVQINAALNDAIAAAGRASDLRKTQYARSRPFVEHPDQITNHQSFPADQYSYPSGHASASYAAARLLSIVNPANADRYFSIAEDVTTSRLYAGMHYASDLVAGARLGVEQADEVAYENREWINDARTELGFEPVFEPKKDIPASAISAA